MVIYEFTQWLKYGIIASPLEVMFFVFAIGIAVGQFYSAFCDWANR